MNENLLELQRIFTEGGWVMQALAFEAVILYVAAIIATIYAIQGSLSVRHRDRWDSWIHDPNSAQGAVGEVIRYALHGPKLSVKRVHRRFDEIREVLVNSLDHQLILISIMIAATPMTGLLGTVLGMLTMFDGLASGGGKKGMEMIAGGMREALFTTLAGLVISLPGMFFALVIKQLRNKVSLVLAQIQAAIVSVKFKGI